MGDNDSKSETIEENSDLPANTPKGITLTHILDLKNRNPRMTMAEVGAALNCCASNIHHHLEKKGYTWEEISEPIGDWNKRKADVLSAIQRNIVNKLSPKQMDKASLKDLIISLGVLVDKEQQIRGNKPVEGHNLTFTVVGERVSINVNSDKSEDNQEVIDVTPTSK